MIWKCFAAKKLQRRAEIVAKALLFDLDGTLLDSVDDLTVAINNTLASRSLPRIDRGDVALFIGKGARVLVQRALTKACGQVPEEKLVDEVLPKYLQEMKLAEGTRTRQIPTVPEALARLQKAGFKMAIVTNKPANVARKLVTQFNLLDFFETVIGAGDVDTIKPDPKMLIEAAHRMGVEIEDCLMIGDSMNDSIAARNAKIPALLVKTGYNEGISIDQWAKQYAPNDLVFDTMVELSDFVIEKERRN